MSPELINNLATAVSLLVAILGAAVFAFWVAMGIWAFNDIRLRSRDWLAILLAVLLVLIFPIVGLALYLMIRPKQTLAEAYDRALEEEALLREIEESMACATCGSPVKENWVYCPNCHNQLQHSCPNCGSLARNEWEICVFCGTAQHLASQTIGGQNASSLRPGNLESSTPPPLRRPRRSPPLETQPLPQPAPTDETATYRPARVTE
jgi:RNA polymerase subunit RPABC4/transcription elongation factor Spt4